MAYLFNMNINRNIHKLLSVMLCCTFSVPVFPGEIVTDSSIFTIQDNMPEESQENNIVTGGGISIPELQGISFPDNSETVEDEIWLHADKLKLSLRQKAGSVAVSWKFHKKAVTYEIYLIRNGKKKRWGVTKKNHVSIKLDNGTSYQVQVLGKNEAGEGVARSKKVSLFLPKKVMDISMCSLGKGKVRICWKKAQKAEKYMIYRREKGSKYQKLGQTAKLSYIDSKLKYGKIYDYKIVPVTKNQLAGTVAVKSFQNKKIVAANHQKYTYEEMEKDIKMLKNKYHGLISSSVIGKSEDGRNIYDVVIGNKNAKKAMLVVSTLHAREYMASLLCMNQIEYYLQNYEGKLDERQVKPVFDNIAVHYIPMANPDGVTISQFGIGSIRNAFLRQRLQEIAEGSTEIWKANAKGVDLNRNFPYSFKKAGNAGSAGFSGEAASSESETRAVLSLIKELQEKKELLGAVNYHAMGSIVFGSCPAKNSAKKITEKMYRLARNLTGYASSSGYSSGKYGSAGNLREYFIYKKKIPSITLEIGKIACPGPISEFPSIWSRNRTLVFREAALLCKK